MPEESKNCPDVGKGHKVGKAVIELQEQKHLAEKVDFKKSHYSLHCEQSSVSFEEKNLRTGKFITVRVEEKVIRLQVVQPGKI